MTAPLSPRFDRAGNCSLGQREGNGRRTGHGAEIRDLAVVANEVAGLDGDVHLGCSLLQIVEDLGAIVELIELRVEQLRDLLGAVVDKDIGLVVGVLRCMGRLDVDDLEDGEAIRRWELPQARHPSWR